MILCYQLGHCLPKAQLRLARPNPGQTDLLDGVAQFHRGAKPCRTVHLIKDSFILRPGGRGRIKWA